jgi:hypothetical protein
MSEQQHTSVFRYLYKFKFENGAEKDFEIRLREEDLSLVSRGDPNRPEWTKLKYFQCENCPLSDTVEYCPVAVNLSGLVDTFHNEVSFQETVVTVETPQRIYQKKTTLQKALSSIIGVYMVTSDCPVMDKLRPMSRFHLPFATSIETFFRQVSMYLMAQLLLARKGKEPDWSLKGLLEIYKAVNLVNKGMSQRLVNASKKDANVNAVVILHSFGDGISYFIEGGLDELEPMFSVLLNGNEEPVDKTVQNPNSPTSEHT